MSEADTQVNIIKQKELNTDLSALLNSYTKVQLTEIADNLNTPAVKSWRKNKLISVVEDSIIEQAATVYDTLIEDILIHFPEPDTQVYRLNDLEDIKAFVPLIKKGFFFVSKEKNDYIFIIPDEIKGDSPISDVSSSKGEVLKEWKERQVSIFGTYSVSHLQKIWNRYFKDDLTVEEVKQLLH